AATDRIAAELVDSLASRPALVVWLFDRTPSAERLRTAVVDRLTEDYRTIEAIKRVKHVAFRDRPEALLSVIGGFTNKLEYLVEEPLADDGQLIAALARLTDGGGNEEATFGAIRQAIEKYL